MLCLWIEDNLVKSAQLNNGPVPFGAEPSTSDSAMVSLNAHLTSVRLQCFPVGSKATLILWHSRNSAY